MHHLSPTYRAPPHPEQPLVATEVDQETRPEGGSDDTEL